MHSPTMQCPKCRQAKLVEINLTLAAHSVVLRSCSYCDQRWWQDEGQPTALPRVLALAGARRR